MTSVRRAAQSGYRFIAQSYASTAVMSGAELLLLLLLLSTACQSVPCLRTARFSPQEPASVGPTTNCTSQDAGVRTVLYARDNRTLMRPR
eukprot:3903666-Prymnesium_polylepis.1